MFPNLLVGAGLLFTFFGLAVALSMAGEIVAEGISQTQRNIALHGLLTTASFKFVTSLFGLLLSICYAIFWRKICLRRIDHALSRFLVELEDPRPLLTPTVAQMETNELARRQLDKLEAFSTESGGLHRFRIGQQAGPAARRSHRPADTGHGATCGRHDDAEPGRRRQRCWMRSCKGCTAALTTRSTRSLSTCPRLARALQGLRTGLQDTANRMADFAELMARRMGEGAEEALSRITNQMGGLLDALRQVTEQTRSAGADAGRDMATRIEQAASGFEAAARTVAETLAQATHDLQRRMTEEAASGSARLSSQFERMIEELRSLAESSRQPAIRRFLR